MGTSTNTSMLMDMLMHTGMDIPMAVTPDIRMGC